MPRRALPLLLLAALALAPGAAAGQEPDDARPRISQLRVERNAATDPVVRAVIDPGPTDTAWHVAYGPTRELGRRTPAAVLPSGSGPVLVRAALAGVAPAQRVVWRVVARNAAGTRSTRRRQFTTLQAPVAVTLALDATTVAYGERVTVRGLVGGAGVGGIAVALVREPFPFGVLSELGTLATDAAGAFARDTGPLLVTTRFRAETRTAALVRSAPVTAFAAARVTAAAGRPGPRDVPVSGTVEPLLSRGLAALQRLGVAGRWHTLERAPLADAVTRSRFAFRAPRLIGARRYRVVVDPRDGGAHVPGASGPVDVPGR